MRIEEFDYELPKELIAKYPTLPRHNARMMVLDRKSRSIFHDRFINLPDYLSEGDLLVFNNTKVIPARLYGRKDTGGKVEVVLTDFITPSRWKALIGGKRIREGLIVHIAEDFKIRIIRHIRESSFEVELIAREPLKAIDRYGHIPIPPYLEREEEDIDRKYYQTIFASEEGAVASPTASLHFSEELMDKLESRGVNTAFITLHVSYGTFKPVKEREIERHIVDSEYIRVPPETVELMKGAKSKGKRIIAVGTTVVRALETAGFEPYEGWTDLYIYPPYKFKVISAMITNFHLPKSSLLILVSAFAGREFLLKAYREAINRSYRFYSYGDGMLIL